MTAHASRLDQFLVLSLSCISHLGKVCTCAWMDWSHCPMSQPLRLQCRPPGCSSISRCSCWVLFDVSFMPEAKCVSIMLFLEGLLSQAGVMLKIQDYVMGMPYWAYHNSCTISFFLTTVTNLVSQFVSLLYFEPNKFTYFYILVKSNQF